MRPRERLAYTISQTARIAWFTGHYLATRRLDRGTDEPGTLKPSPQSRRRARLVRRALLGGAIELVRRDFSNVVAGYYRSPRDMVPNPVEAIRDLIRYYRDLPRARERRLAGASMEARALDVDGAYPDYFTQNFHFQTDGYLSKRSAELYDFQVEILFTGTADAMRRQALVPMADYINGQDVASPVELLDVGCGTGGFLAQIRHSWPNLTLAGLDMSPPYLERARARGQDVAGIDFIQANAETIPLTDASRDIITCVYLFHELPRAVRQTIAMEMARVLRPGGRLILLDSLQLGDTPALDPALLGFPDTFHEPYYRDYLEHDLAACLVDAGLTLIQKTPAYLSKMIVADKPI